MRVAVCVVCILILFCPPALAGVGDLDTRLRGTAIDARGEDSAEVNVTTAPDPDTRSNRAERIRLNLPETIDSPRMREILAKCNARKPLNREEFLDYLTALETLNPGRNWRELLSKLHHEAYPQTSEQSFMGLDFYRDGEENAGYKGVVMPGLQPPTYLIDDDGKVTKVDHTYAGIRAFYNRGAIAGTASALCNTHFGDMGQVAFDAIKGTLKGAAGLFIMATPVGLFTDKDTELVKSGWADVRRSPGYMSVDQIRGNNLSFEVQGRLQARKLKHHASTSPSEWDGWDKDLKLSELFHESL